MVGDQESHSAGVSCALAGVSGRLGGAEPLRRGNGLLAILFEIRELAVKRLEPQKRISAPRNVGPTSSAMSILAARIYLAAGRGRAPVRRRFPQPRKILMSLFESRRGLPYFPRRFVVRYVPVIRQPTA